MMFDPVASSGGRLPCAMTRAASPEEIDRKEPAFCDDCLTVLSRETADAFANPDHVEIVIHNYRWRLGLAEGDPKNDALERRLAEGPAITVPTVTMEGDANGAPHPDPSAYAGKFSGKYAHRLITGGIGHNLPQEAPLAFAEAVIEVDGY